jgi:uncharacterized protein (UPF0254 family)
LNERSKLGGLYDADHAPILATHPPQTTSALTNGPIVVQFANCRGVENTGVVANAFKSHERSKQKTSKKIKKKQKNKKKQ